MGRIYLTIIAALIGVIAALGIHIKGLWFIDGLEDRIAAHERTIASMESASGNSAVMQAALHAENHRLNERIVSDARDRRAALASATTSALAAYAARNRVRADCRGLPGGASAAPVPADPGAPADPAAAADLVAVPREEFEQLGRAAVRAAEHTAFLNDVVAQGLGVAWPLRSQSSRGRQAQGDRDGDRFPEPALSAETPPE